MVQFLDMVTFVAVVESASFTEAAKNLATAKSVVSRRISDLEKELGVVLLDRTTRKVRPTEVGAVYYAKCVRILESVDAANLFVSGFSNEAKGRIRIGISPRLGGMLSAVLNAFAHRYPDIVLDVQNDGHIFDVKEGNYDVRILLGEPEDPNSVAKVLCDIESVLCGSPAYFNARGMPGTLEELASHDGLFDAHSGSSGGWRLIENQSTRIVKVRERLRGDTHHLVEAALDGLGIFFTPREVVSDLLASGRLVAILEAHTPKASPLVLLFPASRRGVNKIQNLVSFLTDHFMQKD